MASPNNILHEETTTQGNWYNWNSKTNLEVIFVQILSSVLCF